MSFVNPIYLFLLLLLPLLFIFAIIGLNNFNKRKSLIINNSNFKKLGLNYHNNQKYISIFIWLISILFIIIAISRPIGGEDFTNVEDNSNDIVIALDLSDSMKARDVTLSDSYSEFSIRENLKNISRFEASKRVIKGFIKNLKGEKISLIAFSDSAFPLTSLSNDYDSFLSFLDNLDYTYFTESGTDIYSALDIAEKRFINKDNSKTIILLSDGEEQNDKAIEKAKELSQKSIKIISIGVGSKDGSKILLGKDLYGDDLYKTYLGNEVISKLNSELLKAISKETNGKYFELGNENISQNISKFINSTASKTNNTQIIKTYKEYYQIFVLLTILLILSEIIIKKLNSIKN